jgi:hypothetical protein
MAQARKSSKKRKRSWAALPVAGAAGLSLATTGGASANAPAVDVPSQDTGKTIVLAEEEITDVSLGTFYVYDKERGRPLMLAQHHGGCGGCGGCGHGGACAARPGGCMGGGGGCAAHPSGCVAGGHPGGCGGCGCAGHRGCRGCGGCGCGVGVWIGGCGGCGGGCGTCWQWDPVLLDWVYVCY